MVHHAMREWRQPGAVRRRGCVHGVVQKREHNQGLVSQRHGKSEASEHRCDRRAHSADGPCVDGFVALSNRGGTEEVSASEAQRIRGKAKEHAR